MPNHSYLRYEPPELSQNIALEQTKNMVLAKNLQFLGSTHVVRALALPLGY